MILHAFRKLESEALLYRGSGELAYRFATLKAEVKKTLGFEKLGKSNKNNIESDLKSKPLPSPEIYCTSGDDTGEIDLQWDPVTGAQGYLIEVSEERPFHWRVLHTSVKSKYTAVGLQPGTNYWFRVCAMNAEGNSPWSLPILKKAP